MAVLSQKKWDNLSFYNFVATRKIINRLANPPNTLLRIPLIFFRGSRAAVRPSHGGLGNSEGPQATVFANSQPLKTHRLLTET